MVFSEIEDEVEDLLLDLPTGTTTRIPAWINEAIKDACRRHNFRCMETEQSATSVDQTRALFTKPSDWKERRGEPYLVNQDGSTTPISWAQSEAQMTRTYAAQAPSESNPAAVDEGEPRYLLETETAVNVYPLPDDESDWDNGLYRVRVPYWKYLATMSAAGDTNFFTVESPWYVIFYAVSMGIDRNRDEERADRYAEKAEREFIKLKNRDKMSRLGDKLTLQVHKDVYAAEPRRGNREG